MRSRLFYELLLVELDFRRSQGEHPTRNEYVQRFPTFADQIEAACFKPVSGVFATSKIESDDTVRSLRHQTGDRIAQFQLTERLGAGAMGEVWKAWDSRLQRPVALKLVFSFDHTNFFRTAQTAA